MTTVKGQVRHDVTIQCPICGHVDVIDMESFPLDSMVDCDECGEELRIELEDAEGEKRPFWKDWKR